MRCNTSDEAQPLLGKPTVILCDQELANGHWRRLLSEIETMPNRPAPIVTSRAADAALWGGGANTSRR